MECSRVTVLLSFSIKGNMTISALHNSLRQVSGGM